MYLKYYLNSLGYQNLPAFIKKYLKCPSLTRLKKVGYFCGMDYASKDIYNFKEYISRYDHSLTTALITYKLTKDKKATIAALFHDVGTPCFSHVIDYMNKDYDKQESTEEFTEKLIMNDNYLQELLKEDNINSEEVIDFKRYTVVDNNRPKLCADRLDGIILTGLFWTKSIKKKDITEILDNIYVTKNEYNEDEISFKNKEVANKVLKTSNLIDKYCHTKEDNYMMLLLADIVKLSIKNKYISYDDLFIISEIDLFNLLFTKKSKKLQSLLNKFETIKKEEITNIKSPNIKNRILNPLVDNQRLNSVL